MSYILVYILCTFLFCTSSFNLFFPSLSFWTWPIVCIFQLSLLGELTQVTGISARSLPESVDTFLQGTVHVESNDDESSPGKLLYLACGVNTVLFAPCFCIFWYLFWHVKAYLPVLYCTLFCIFSFGMLLVKVDSNDNKNDIRKWKETVSNELRF